MVTKERIWKATAAWHSSGRFTWAKRQIRLLALSSAAFVLAGNIVSAATFYVATNGNDLTNSGDIDHPFATLEKARDTLRQLNSANALTNGATVFVRGGTYTRTNTLTLSPSDSGGGYAYPIVWRAYTNEVPVLVGALPVKNWGVYSSNILVSDVSTQEVGTVNFHQLYFNGERQILARFPNYNTNDPYHSGWSYVTTPNGSESYVSFNYASGDVHSWGNPTQAEVFIFPGEGWWNKISRIRSIDTTNRIISLAQPDTRLISTNNRYYVQNVFEELDAPGEWYLNTSSHLLYFYPPRPVSPETPVYAPVLNTFVAFAAGTSNVIWRGFTMEYCTNTAVSVSSGVNVVIAGNTIRCVGDFDSFGVSVSGGFTNGIVGNDISYIGFHGIYIDGGNRTTLTPANNYADNNFIHDCGVFNKRAGGIQMAGVGNRLSNNFIHDTPRVGIYVSAGNNWVIEYNILSNVVTEVDDAGGIYVGADNDWISDRGSVVRYNRIENAQGYGFLEGAYYAVPMQAYGVYLDGMTMGVDVIGNIIRNCSFTGIMVNGGRDNHIYNNIIADCSSSQIYVSMFDTNSSTWVDNYDTMVAAYDSVAAQPAWAGMRGMDISPTNQWPNGNTLGGIDVATNILSYTNTSASAYWYSGIKAIACELVLPSSNRWDYNTYYHNEASVSMYEWNTNASFAQWQALGFDTHGTNGNPQINANWIPQTNSPALALGFRQIPVDKIGCYDDEYRASWPLVLTGDNVNRPAPPTNLAIIGFH